MGQDRALPRFSSKPAARRGRVPSLDRVLALKGVLHAVDAGRSRAPEERNVGGRSGSREASLADRAAAALAAGGGRARRAPAHDRPRPERPRGARRRRAALLVTPHPRRRDPSLQAPRRRASGSTGRSRSGSNPAPSRSPTSPDPRGRRRSEGGRWHCRRRPTTALDTWWRRTTSTENTACAPARALTLLSCLPVVNAITAGRRVRPAS